MNYAIGVLFFCVCFVAFLISDYRYDKKNALKPVCSSCVYWSSSERGRCKRYPQSKTQTQTFIYTNATDWCGEYKQAKPTDK